jgi:hypothetical protein
VKTQWCNCETPGAHGCMGGKLPTEQERLDSDRAIREREVLDLFGAKLGCLRGEHERMFDTNELPEIGTVHICQHCRCLYVAREVDDLLSL